MVKLGLFRRSRTNPEDLCNAIGATDQPDQTDHVEQSLEPLEASFEDDPFCVEMSQSSMFLGGGSVVVSSPYETDFKSSNSAELQAATKKTLRVSKGNLCQETSINRKQSVRS
mmetsp:Transcript_9232/g.19514  ORF Transcript_9232/g.19514 Transcript_9232/m.19514 type:complete len:113 (-) Transcript_9232:72-410(-)|eukprot:CAMPEP_0185845176 /NCGR_PEP_ID=MMETSP1354-20130828/1210_1 /TAXON_ID=708628 /ORGANISM="Erythrolobus madagascarensis, Strain CCMP3276" /LENGTH=112 /DNA_ID=CAMNT_0028545071 /DNA_START=71 /DNA_END=409 /DNA_ORIENTATION=+